VSIISSMVRTTPEQQFQHELEVFRTEEETATQFFYAYVAVHSVAYDNETIEALLNTAPLFWNTCMGALQTGAFIALGRIFDQNSTHNIDRLLRLAQDNKNIFSKAALARRKQGDATARPPWLDEFLREKYEPTAMDFRRLRAHVKKWRRIYENTYRDVRHKWFAHKEISDPASLFQKGSIRELQRLFAFLGSLYNALWQLFFNGLKPVLRPRRYSVIQIRRMPAPTWKRGAVQETITREAEQFLMAACAMRRRDKLLARYFDRKL
jgi:hypothetical protein